MGGKEFKEQLLKEHSLSAESRAWETAGKGEIQQADWAKMFQKGCRTLGRKPADLHCRPAAQPWKIALMLWMKQHTQASNTWLAEQFGLSRPKYISRLVWAARRRKPLPPELALLREQGAT